MIRNVKLAKKNPDTGKLYIPMMRDLREDHDFTQEVVAKYLGISQHTYSEYERGKVELPIKHLMKLAKLYHVTTDYILGLSKKKIMSRIPDGEMLTDFSTFGLAEFTRYHALYRKYSEAA